MHAGLYILVYWGVAFFSLGLALVLLNIYDGVIGNDLVLGSVRSEAVIVGISSLIEGVSFWAVATFVPTASRALIVPALVVALIYQATHFEDWGRFDVVMLLFFQMVIGFIAVSLLAGHFQAALGLTLGFGLVLTVFGFCVRGLFD